MIGDIPWPKTRKKLAIHAQTAQIEGDKTDNGGKIIYL